MTQKNCDLCGRVIPEGTGFRLIWATEALGVRGDLAHMSIDICAACALKARPQLQQWIDKFRGETKPWSE